MKKLLLFIFGLFTVLSGLARNFEYEYEGKTLIYTVISEEKKTCQLKEGSYELEGRPGNYVSGKLIIPSVASDGLSDYTVTTISAYAFVDQWMTEVIIPRSVTSIEYSAFRNCRSLTEVKIGDSVTSIAAHAFQGCRSLTKLTIPDSVTSIGEYAFDYCKKLEEITIPNSVTSIGKEAFLDCNSLKKVNFASIESLCNIEFGNHSANPLYSAERLYINGEEIKSLVISNSVTSIGRYAFYNCTNLTDVTIPNSVTSIGGAAFANCTGLTELTIPNSVTSIGEGVFSNCSGLTELTIPNSVTSIKGNAFKNCTGLTELTIPNSVTSIGEWAFEGCTGLTSLIIGNSVTYIGDGAFYECSGLTKVLSMSLNPPTAATRFPFDKKTYQNAVLLVEYDAMDAYLHSYGWREFANTSYYTSFQYIAWYQEFRNIIIGDEIELTASSNLGLNVEYLSSNTAVAEIEGNIVKFVGAGEVSITAIQDGNYAIDAAEPVVKTITVYPAKVFVESLVLNETELQLKVDETYQFEATILPKDAFDKTLIWSSSDTSVATVSEDGVVSALKSGEAVITATAADGSGAQTSCNVYVTAKLIPVETITLSASEWNAVEGETMRLSATVMPENATDKSIVWSSSDTSVAIVSEDGVVSALKPGEAVITATAADGSGVNASCNVNVIAKFISVESLTLDPSTWSGEEGESFQITAIMLPENASEKTLEWASSFEDVATVDNTGIVNVKNVGSCVITAKTTDGSNLSAECIITSMAGIDDVFADGVSFDVYSIQGALIDTDCTRDDLKKLSSGVYILRSSNKSSKIIIR